MKTSVIGNEAAFWYQNWNEELLTHGPRMSDRQALACAQLATVLLCGEQSAIRIFAIEAERSRHRGAAEAIRQLATIEQDELHHEMALLRFCNYLPTPHNDHELRRHAQRFFFAIGRCDSMAQQFSQIAQLDTAVCKIMWHVENSEIDALSPLRLLATHIKLDESRHVAISRQYSEAMGYGRKQFFSENELLCENLVVMLSEVSASFEDVGVDCDRLFTRLKHVDRS